MHCYSSTCCAVHFDEGWEVCRPVKLFDQKSAIQPEACCPAKLFCTVTTSHVGCASFSTVARHVVWLSDAGVSVTVGQELQVN